jgi:hypothetical protein
VKALGRIVRLGIGGAMTEQSPAQPNESEADRLGHRRSFWGRMRNRITAFSPSSRRANEDPRAIGLQGDHPIGPINPL